MLAAKNLLRLATLACLAGSAISQDEIKDWPVHDNGLTDTVQWDHHSYMVNGQRLFIFSGEFHPWRYPVPELWRDLLEKVKAAGFNAFSIYASWGYHSASPDALDFTNGGHNITSIFTLAKELGMYVIVRPGPYVNAETNAGGFPLWLTTGEYGALRDDDDRYTKAWTPFWEEISGIIEPHLITKGGNVIMFQIENELNGQWKNIAQRVLNPPVADYMQLLQDSARDSGIDVPLAHNAPNMNGYSWSRDFSNATGNVDVVGLDSYPSCWSCNLSECTGTNGAYVPYQTIDYSLYFSVQSPSQPNFMPEFQGGSYNPWGGPQGGCPGDIGADFANLFYRDLLYQRVTAISLYMLFGGTNWGHSACPVVATSYDYSSPVSENRQLWSKYYETKLVVMFTRVAHDLAYTNRVGNGTGYTDNDAIRTAELRNPDTDAAFYVVLHKTSSSNTKETFKLKVNTTEGDLTIPQFGNAITINGHQAKVLVTDFKVGDRTLLYSTAEVLSYAEIDGKAVLALWLPEGEAGEFRILGDSSAKLMRTAAKDSVDLHKEEGGLTVSYVQQKGTSIVELEDGTRILMMDRSTAYHFWAPSLTSDPIVPANATVFVQGPYLVRHASYSDDGKTLHLTGDESEDQEVTVFASRKLCGITWNGDKVEIKSRNGGMYVVTVKGPGKFELEPLAGWEWTDSLPELASNYSLSDDVWVVADKTTTPNPTKPAGNNPVLYVDDYEIHYGNHLYRATFPSTKEAPTGLSLNVQGGFAFGYSVWVNSDYIGSYYGLSYEGAHEGSFSFENATLTESGENTLLVLMDQSGHELRAEAIQPRGILNATLTGPAADGYTFSEWRIAGNAGREENIDPMRGPMNEGGLYAERVGMHLPGYPAKGWSDVDSDTGTLVVPSAGVRAFRTVAPLDVPKGLDVSITFRLTSTSDKSFTPSDAGYSNRLRAMLFVNGYQYGRFNPYIGHQIDFPVPPGILDYHGDNTIVVTVWSQDANGVEMKVDWDVTYVHTTSFDMGFDSSELRPGWTEERLKYA